MNLRLGRTGKAEGICVVSTALSAGGLFSFEARTLYAHGNSTYLTLPAAILISLELFLAILKMMEKSGCRDLWSLLSLGFGESLAAAVVPLLCFLLIFAAHTPIGQFVRAMHGLFFEGVSYSKLVIYIVPTVLVVALLGFETIGRTAKCFAFPLLGVLIFSIFAASAEFEPYRLFPLPGSTAAGLLRQTLSEVGTFFPTMAALLVTSEGLNDRNSVKKIGVISALIAALICFAAQLSIGLIYTYRELTGQFMPLFRLSYLNLFEAHLMRMDKLANMIWLNSALILGAFHIYAAALLYIKAFGIRDIRPTLTVLAFLTALLILLETETESSSAIMQLREKIEAIAFIISAAAVFAAGIAGLVKSKSRGEYYA